MYKQVPSQPHITLYNGSICRPIVSLADEYGGEAHIIIDDGCYVLVNMREGKGRMSPWIFPEAFRALKELPPLEKRDRRLEVVTTNTTQ